MTMNTTIQLKFEHHPEPEFQLPIQNYHEFYRFYLRTYPEYFLCKSSLKKAKLMN